MMFTIHLISFFILIIESSIVNSLPINLNIKKNGCTNFFVFQLCQNPNLVHRTNKNENQETSRQMTVSMDTQSLNVYDGILQSGSPSLTVWTTYNTRGEKTFGIDITEYVISFIERFISPLFPENFISGVARSHRQKLRRSGEEKHNPIVETNISRNSFVQRPSQNPNNLAPVTLRINTASLNLKNNPPTNIDWLKALIKFATERNASILE